MVEWLNEILSDTTINPSTAVLKMLLSLVLGIIIGAERQMRRRDAGLRTFTLIVMGSTCAMLLSIWIPQIYPNFLNGDPGRIAAQVITGIGFLGAGAIMQGKGSIQGLTTAASIWQAAVIGLAVGAGLYLVAVLATGITLFVLIVMEHFEQGFVSSGANKIMTITCSTTEPDIALIKSVIEDNKVQTSSYTFSADFDKGESVIVLKVTLKHAIHQLSVSKDLHNKVAYVKSISLVA